MKINNAILKSVKMDWDAITLPLKEGSPISLNGVVSNSSSAIGLVMETIKVRPIVSEMYILVGGDVDLAEVNKAYGSSLETTAIESMDGIRFFEADGTIHTPAKYVLPSATATAIGGVKMASNCSLASGEAPTKAEFDAVITALINAGIMAEAEEE